MPEIIPVDNLNEEELRMYSCTSEVQLRRCFEPEPGIFIAESPKVILRALDAGYEPLSLLAEERLVAHALERMGLRQEESQLREETRRREESLRQEKSLRQEEPLRQEEIQLREESLRQEKSLRQEESSRQEKAPQKEESLRQEECLRWEESSRQKEILRQKESLRRKESQRNPELLGRILERCEHVPVYTADPGVLVRITGYHLTQGVLCAMRRRALPAAETVCAGASRIAVLEGIVNPTNVGAIFRSAAALGLGAVLLTSGCCDPLYRRAVRVSMGTVFQIPWTYLDVSPPEYVGKLKQMGFAAAAMALEEDSVGIDDPNLAGEKRLAVLLGNEGEGLNAATIRACDYTVKIPMAHDVDSLNVAAASAVVFWQLTR